MFKIAEISLTPRNIQVAAPVKFCLRHSFRHQITTGMVMIRNEVATQIGLKPKVTTPIRVEFGEGEDFGKLRFRIAKQGEVSNSLARPGNGKQHIYFIPLGQQKIFASSKLPATICEFQVDESSEETWLELIIPAEALKNSSTPKPIILSRKEVLSKIGKMSA